MMGHYMLLSGQWPLPQPTMTNGRLDDNFLLGRQKKCIKLETIIFRTRKNHQKFKRLSVCSFQ